MRTNEKIRLLSVWSKNPFAEFSRREIMDILNKKTKTWAFKSLKEMVSNQIIKSRRKANIDLYSLNISNPLSFRALQYLELTENLKFSGLSIISEIIEKVPTKSYSLIVFGSYAENKQTQKSDLDICFLIDNKTIEKKIRPYIHDIKLNYSIKIDDNYVIFNDFIKMLLRNDENLSKQIFKKHKLFYNPDIYYQLIKEAYKHGFRP